LNENENQGQRQDEKQGQDDTWKPVGLRMRIKDWDRDEKKVRIISGNQLE
jgi:hypothetical protein